MTESRLPIADMDKIAESFEGRISYFVKRLSTGETHHYDAERPSPIASICKIPVMIELFKQVEEGQLSLSDRSQLPNGIIRHGTGVLNMMEDSPELSLHDYCRLMIYVSDNMATDVLMDIVGLESLNWTMEEMGFHQTRTRMSMGTWHLTMVDMQNEPRTPETDARYLRNVKARDLNHSSIPFQDSLDNNVTSAMDMGNILEQMYNGQMVNPKASEEMVKMLMGCRSRTKIPLNLNPEIPVAHKVGGSGRIQGDAGIVYLPGEPIVIVVLTVSDEDSKGSEGSDAIAEISTVAIKSISPENLA